MKILLFLLLATVFAEELPKTADEAFNKIDWSLFKEGNHYCEPKLSGTIQKRRPKLSARIFKGQLVTANTQQNYKYIVRLISDNIHRRRVTVGCGGALINKNTVLTAAHCLKDQNKEFIEVDDVTGKVWVERITKHQASYTQMYFGITDLDKATLHEDGTESRIAYATEFTIHPKWDPAGAIVKYDIAIIKIQDIIPGPTSKFAYISLPSAAICKIDHGKVKSFVDISGWGMTDETSSTRNLKTSQIFVRDHTLCSTSFSAYDEKNMICANTDEGSGTCGGDSGGPLAYTDKDLHKYLLGITSFGASNCTDGRPSVFTNVCAYNEWINKIIN